MNFFIYALISENELGYIGCSSTGLKRPQSHWKYTQSKKSGRLRHLELYKWLKTLSREPTIVIIENCYSRETMLIAEKTWIHYFRELGCNLRNMTDGGDGTFGYKLSVKQRFAIKERVSKKWQDHEFRERNRQAQIEAQNRPDVKAKRMGANNISKRLEVRTKQSASASGKKKSTNHIESLRSAASTQENRSRLSLMKRNFGV